MEHDIEALSKKMEKSAALHALVNTPNTFPFLLMYAYLYGKGQDIP